ncbi:acyl-CoA dehydrogenase family protein, partial [Burkholderia pseudomallei]|uniref:acyl-CoA dehydrogenase family protein n=1 Tax=Burkholderia pseudomallei TaxID=28450 RepID=UPI002156046B
GCVCACTEFRAGGEAARGAGDAMEVRGGTGCIEEWSDARVLRDGHLGSIWEGTSNIVALDVARAVKREGARAPLRAFLLGARAPARLPGASATRLRRALARASDASPHAGPKADDACGRAAAAARTRAAAATPLDRVGHWFG